MEVTVDNSMADIISGLEDESAMKLWSGIYICGDTNVHPYVVKFISDMIGSLALSRVIEVATHDGVLARYWAINNPDTIVLAVGEDNMNVRANLGELTNVERLASLEGVRIETQMVIINYGLSLPEEADVVAAMDNLYYNQKGRLVALGYESANLKDEYSSLIDSSDKLRKIWGKMDSIVIEYTK